MRGVGAFTALLLLGAGWLYAQAAPSGRRPAKLTRDSIAQTLVRLEDGWANALVRRDSSYFARVLDRGFIYTEDDRTSTRAEVLRDIFADTVMAAHNEGMQVHHFGNTAVVIGWLTMQGHGSKGPFDRRYRFTDVWMQRPAGWQIIAAHDYLVPPGK
jgi:hypothetical protein